MAESTTIFCLYASVVSWSQHILIYMDSKSQDVCTVPSHWHLSYMWVHNSTQEPNHQSNQSGKQRVVMNILTSWCQITQCFSRCPHFVLHGQSFAAPWGWVTIAGYMYISVLHWGMDVKVAFFIRSSAMSKNLSCATCCRTHTNLPRPNL